MDRTPDPNDPFADGPEASPVSPAQDPFSSPARAPAHAPGSEVGASIPDTAESDPAGDPRRSGRRKTHRHSGATLEDPRRGSAGSGGRSLARLSLMGVAILLGLLLLDGIWVAYSVQKGLQDARGSLESGAQAVREGNFDEASGNFHDAESSASGASSSMGHPAAKLIAAFPLVGDDADAIASLARTAQLTAQAGGIITDAATEAGLSAGQGSLLTGGKIDLASIETAAAGLDEADGLLRQAKDLVSAIDADGLIEPIREPIATARVRLEELTSTTAKAKEIAELLPPMLGGDGSRRYLVVMMSLADPRGSGGYPGEYGILTVKDGKMDLATMTPMGDLGSVPPVKSVEQAQLRYLRWGGNTHFIASTYSPDFPTSGKTITAMWDAKGLRPVDGVIGVDAVWVANLLSSVGPVQIKGHDEPVTSTNAADVLIREPYLLTDQTKSDALQAKLGTGLMGAIIESSPEPADFLTAMSDSIADRHLQIYSIHREEQKSLAELGAAGSYELGRNPLAIAWQGAAPQRTGYFAEKAIHYEATINDDGSVDVVMDVRVHNGAPDSPPSILLGDGKDYPVGYNSVYANVYLPENATKMTTEVIGGPGLQLFEREFNRPVILQYLGMDSGQSQTARFTYTIPAPAEGGRDSFQVDITPQPALRPEHVSVEIVTPSGTIPSSQSPDVSVTGQSAEWQGTPTRPTSIAVSY